jgi:hypothetical protein
MKKVFCLFFVGFGLLNTQAQTVNLFEEKDSLSTSKNYVQATFKSTRLVHGHSVELQKKGVLDFRVHHRFGVVSNGVYDFFGLDNASTLIGFDYGLTNNINVGVSRSTNLKQMEVFAKLKLLSQTQEKGNPFTATLFANAINRSADILAANGTKLSFSDKTQYTIQLLLARKFSDNFSLQLMPTMVHYNLVTQASDPNQTFALGFGGRQKISKRVSINTEYYLRLNKLAAPAGQTYYNSLVLGVDIETGGHVFQLHFTNSRGMTAPTFINETNYSWGKGEFHFGFNISRVFVVKKPKEFK